MIFLSSGFCLNPTISTLHLGSRFYTLNPKPGFFSSSDSGAPRAGSRKEGKGGWLPFSELVKTPVSKMTFNQLAATLGLVLEAHNPGKVHPMPPSPTLWKHACVCTAILAATEGSLWVVLHETHRNPALPRFVLQVMHIRGRSQRRVWSRPFEP